MKPCLFLLLLLVGATARAEEPTKFHIHLDKISPHAFFQVYFRPEDKGRHDLILPHFVLRAALHSPAVDKLLVLRAPDLRAVIAMVEYLVEREKDRERELNILIRGDDLRFMYSLKAESRGSVVALNWDDLQIRFNGDAVDAGEITAYLRYQQGLFNYDYSKEFVTQTLDKFFEAAPYFGRWQRCARLLAHVPWLKL